MERFVVRSAVVVTSSLPGLRTLHYSYLYMAKDKGLLSPGLLGQARRAEGPGPWAHPTPVPKGPCLGLAPRDGTWGVICIRFLILFSLDAGGGCIRWPSLAWRGCTMGGFYLGKTSQEKSESQHHTLTLL